MRAVKIVVALIASAGFVIAADTAASADSTHICQGAHNCNDDGGGHGGGGGGHGGGHGGGGGNDQELECSNEGGGLIIIQANVCPQDFPILVDIL